MLEWTVTYDITDSSSWHACFESEAQAIECALKLIRDGHDVAGIRKDVDLHITRDELYRRARQAATT